MLTQSLEKEHWNWSDKAPKFIEEENIREIGQPDYETILLGVDKRR